MASAIRCSPQRRRVLARYDWPQAARETLAVLEAPS